MKESKNPHVEWGRIGGKQTYKTYGSEHMKELGKKGYERQEVLVSIGKQISAGRPLKRRELIALGKQAEKQQHSLKG